MFDLITGLAGIGTAVALFSVVKRQHEGLAPGFVTSRIYEGAVIMIVSAPILLSATLGIAFGVNDPQSAWTALATVPVFCWELVLGLYLTFKGFRSSAALFAGSTASDQRAVTAPASATIASNAGAA